MCFLVFKLSPGFCPSQFQHHSGRIVPSVTQALSEAERQTLEEMLQPVTPVVRCEDGDLKRSFWRQGWDQFQLTKIWEAIFEVWIPPKFTTGSKFFGFFSNNGVGGFWKRWVRLWYVPLQPSKTDFTWTWSTFSTQSMTILESILPKVSSL